MRGNGFTSKVRVWFGATEVNEAQSVPVDPQHVQVVAQHFHQFTSMQSRILINPSLILVFTVPRATPSSFATCG